MSINESQALEFRPSEDELFTPEKAKQQVQYIQKIMAGVMQDGQHYGIIPGCGDKPSLLKPGAEKLCMVFRLSATYEITKTNLDRGHREYEIVCTLTDSNTGKVQGQGVGMATSLESKWRYRTAGLVCPKCDEEAVIVGKKEFGGGFVCFKKKGGCNAKFKDDDASITSQKQGRVENDNPADQFNTVMKIAKKRSHVDAVLTVLAASDIFTQDIEDMDIKPTNDSPPKTEEKTQAQKNAEAKAQADKKKADAKKTKKEKGSEKKNDPYPDQSDASDATVVISEDEALDLVAYAKEKGWSETAFKKLLKDNDFDRILDITTVALPTILKLLDN